MLATIVAKRVADAVEPRVSSQEIDVPVRPWRDLLVVRDAGAYPSRPEGAAHVNVEAASKFERTELPDLDQPISGTKQDQCVSAASWFHDCTLRQQERGSRPLGVRGSFLVPRKTRRP